MASRHVNVFLITMCMIVGLSGCEDGPLSGGDPHLQPPGTPTVSAANLTADSFTITARWARSPVAVRYNWQTGSENGSWTLVGQSPDTSAVTRVPRIAGNGYWFCATAVISDGTQSLASCNVYTVPSGGPQPVATVNISPASREVNVGASVQLTATARDQNGTTIANQSFAWASSNSSVATVSASGLVQAVAPGSVVITATTNGVMGGATVTVLSGPSSGSITIAPLGPLTVAVGAELSLSATARDGTGAPVSNPGLVWSSSNQGVATVNTMGLVTGRAAGTVLITAAAVCCGSSSVEVAVGQQNPGSGTTVSWDWSTALGTTSAAILDNSKATPLSSWRTAADLPLLNVVSASALNYPTPNALRVTLTASSSSDVRAIDLWPAPAPGQSLYYRMYVRYDIPDSYGTLGPASHHPIQPEPGVCPGAWAFFIGSFPDGTLDVGINFQNSNAGFFLTRVLRKYQTYRWEWAFHRQSNGSYKADIRIFDTSGVLVADARNFISRWSPDYTSSMAERNPDLNISDACIRRLMIGYNGPAWPSMTNAYAYFGAVAVRLSNSPTDWIGAHR